MTRKTAHAWLKVVLHRGFTDHPPLVLSSIRTSFQSQALSTELDPYVEPTEGYSSPLLGPSPTFPTGISPPYTTTHQT